METQQIVIYQTEDGQTQIDVRLENETVWLTQAQMAELFQTDRTSIVRHINNIYKVEELEKNSTCAKIAQVQTEGKRNVRRYIPYFNLDMIISVGYRINSKRGIKFRQWANKVLKEYLVKGYAVNDRIRKEQIGELRQLVGMLGRTIQSQPPLSTDESNALFEVVTDYTYALDTLDNYDNERLTIEKTTKEEPFHATYENAMQEINRLREKFGGLPLVAKNKPFDKGSLNAAFRVYRMGYPDFGYGVYDTLCVSRRVLPELENHQLHTVAAACGYQLENHHHALADAEACAWIAREIL